MFGDVLHGSLPNKNDDMRNKLFLLVFALLACVAGASGQTWLNAYSIGSTTTSINDKNYGACTDAAGNKYFAGNFTGTSDFDPGSATNNLVAVAGSTSLYNCYLTKYDQSGAYQYAVRLGTSTSYSSMNLGCICTDGTYVYLYGGYQGVATFGSYTFTAGAGELNLFICKILASDGTVVWAQSYGGTALDFPFSICTDNSGGLYINGTFNGSTTLGTFDFTAYIAEGFTAKVNASDGTVAWATTYGTTNGNSEGQNGAIVYAPSVNKVYAMGMANGSAHDHGVYGDFTHYLDTAGNDAVMLEINPANGHIDNATFYASAYGNDNIYGACYDSVTGDVFITGSFETTLTLPGTSTLPPTNGFNGALLVARYSTTAHDFVWAKSINTNTSPAQNGIRNSYRAITSDNHGHIYGAGSFYGTVTVGSDTYTSAAICDMLVTSFDAYTGDIRWSEHIDDGTGPGNNNVFTGVAVDRDGKMALGGFNTAPNVMFGSIVLPYLNFYNNLFAFMDVPMVKTQNVTSVTTTTALLTAVVVNDGGNSVTEKGIVWSASGVPTMSSNVIPMGSGSSGFSQELSGLTPGSKYYVRPYIVTPRGTFLGAIDSFSTIALPPAPVCNAWSDVTGGLNVHRNSIKQVAIASDTSGLTYVSYADSVTGLLYVKKFNGRTWESVGAGAVSEYSFLAQSLAVTTNGELYVAYKENGNTPFQRVVVKKFDGVDWVSVSSTNYFDPVIETPNIQLAAGGDGSLWLSYTNDETVNNYPLVRKLIDTGWVTLITTAIPRLHLPISVDRTGILYTVMSNYVYKFDGGVSWLGDGEYTSGVVKARGVATDPAGKVVVLYEDSLLMPGRASVIRYNGSAWESLGNLGAGSLKGSSLIVDKNGNVLVGVIDPTATNKANVYKYGTGWSVVASQEVTMGNIDTTLMVSGPYEQPGLSLLVDSALHVSSWKKTNPSVDAGPVADVPQGNTTAFLPHSNAIYAPTKYSIMWNAAAISAGFTNVTDATLPASTIAIAVPATAAIDSYYAKLVVKNDEECSSDSVAIKVNVVLPNITPTFLVATPQQLVVCKNSGAADIKNLLHAKDGDAGQTLTWTQQSAPAHGTLTITGATSSSGSADITPGGTITYQPAANYGGSDAFTVRVSDGSAFSDMVINVTVESLVANITPTNVTCNGGNNGQANATASGGTAPYNYIWSMGAVSQSATGLLPGTYQVWITDAYGCEATDTAIVADAALLTASITGGTTICSGTSTTITFTSTPNAIVGYTINGGSVQHIELNSAGSGSVNTGTIGSTVVYALVDVSAGTCSNNVSGNATVNTFAMPTIDTVADQVLCNNAATEAVVFAGTAASYSWTNSNNTIGLATSGTGDIAAFAAINTGSTLQTATVTVTPISGACAGAPTMFVISVKPTPTVIAHTDAVACNGEPVDGIDFAGNMLTTAYNWSNSDATIGIAASGVGNIASFDAINTSNVTHTSTIVVTPANNGCTGVADTFSITVHPTPTVDAVTDQVVCNANDVTAVDFDGTVAATVFSWHNNNTSIGLEANNTTDIPSFAAVNTGADPVTATITVLPTANGCPGPSDTFTITVNPTPIASAVSGQDLCNGSTTAAVSFSSATSGATYSWSNSNSSIGLATTGTGDISAFAAINAGSSIETATVHVTPVANNCSGPVVTMVYTVYPTPVITPIADQAICNGFNTTAVTFESTVTGSTFSWTNSNSLIGLALFGSTYGIPSFPAMNTGTGALVSTLVVTPSVNGCAGSADTFAYTVTPTPTVNATGNQVLCNNDTTASISFTGTTPGTLYSWTNSNTSIGTTASGSGDIASFTATNAGSVFDTATFVVTPSIGVCNGNAQSFEVVVKPTPTVNAISNQVLCNTAATVDVMFTGSVIGTSNDWTNTNTNIGLAASGNGNIFSFTATNSTTAPISGTVTVVPSANGCVGAPEDFTYTVNPTPKFSSAQVGTVCSGAPFVYTPASATAGTAFAWARASVGGISNAPAAGSGGFNETLINTMLAPKTVTYAYSLTANGCTNNQNVLVTVNPAPDKPVIAISPVADVCRNTLYQNFGAATAAPDSVDYTWSANGAVIFAQGTGNQNSVVNFPVSGDAQIVLTSNATGFTCYARDTATISVGSGEASNAEVFYVNDHFIYTDNTVDAYQWGYDDAASLDSSVFSGQVDQNFYHPAPDFSGKKYWVMTTKDGCRSKSYYNAPVGVVNVNGQTLLDMRVFPNPATDNVYVEVSGSSLGHNVIQLSDITGKVIDEAVLTGGTGMFSIANLASAVYVINYYHDGVRVASYKLVKN